MNPFQLLAVGQSLVKKGNKPSPYKMDEQHLLPKFATVGRPVSLAPAPKPVEVPKDLFRSAREASAEPAVSEAAEGAPVSTRHYRVLVASARPAAAKPAAPKAMAQESAAPKAVAAVEVAKKAKRGFFGLGRKNRDGRLVQTELRLDAVRVMRNDLNDSDLEIVASKPTPVPAPVEPVVTEARVTEAPVSPTERVEGGAAAVSLWKRWIARLMGAMRLTN